MAQNVWFAQLIELSEDLSRLQRSQLVSCKSKLKALNPFIDQDMRIPVGDRLTKSSLTEYQKFPIVLPGHHKIIKIIFETEYKRLLHAGPQALLASIQIKFWPLGGRNTAIFTVHYYITCFRYQPTTLTPIMALLPRQRTVVDRPFTHTR